MLSPRGPRDPVRQRVDTSTEKLKSGVSRCPGWQRQSEQAEQVKKKKFCSVCRGAGQLGPGSGLLERVCNLS